MLVPTQSGNRLTGLFKGVVKKHLGYGKCKIWIPGVYPDELEDIPDALPDAEQITPLFAGSNKGNGIFSYPNLGSIVACGFWNDDQNYPYFIGSILGGENAQEEYSEARCEASPESIESGDDARVHKITVDLSTIKIWESGHIEIRTKHDRKAIPDQESIIDIDQAGNINIKSTTQVHIESPEIMMDTKTFCMNTNQMIINTGYGSQLNTDTLKVNAKTETDITSPSYVNINSKSNNMISPVINIDGSQGSVAIKGKFHNPIFV